MAQTEGEREGEEREVLGFVIFFSPTFFFLLDGMRGTEWVTGFIGVEI